MLLMEQRFKTYSLTGVWPKRIPVRKVIDITYKNTTEVLTPIKVDSWTLHLMSYEHRDYETLADDGLEADWSGATEGESR